MKTNEKPSKETLDQWHKDPSNWKWVFFYYNPKDKRIFPPKRFMAFGWTVNFSNPVSYLTLLGIIILFLLIFNYM